MLINDFIIYFSAVLGRADRTCQEYAKEIRYFAAWLEPDMPQDDVLKLATRHDIRRYVESCSNLSAATRARKISTLRTFYAWCVANGHRPDNPVAGMPRPKITRSLPVYLSLDDAKALVRSARSRGDLFYRRRNTLIIILYINCGLRLSELAGVQMHDVYDDAIRIVGKGGKERYVYLNQSCQRALRLWLGKRGHGSGYLIVSKQGQGLSPSSLASVVKIELAKVGLGHLSTHKLRHTAATLLYRYGHVDIRILQSILGHASIATTEIYTHVVSDQVIAAMESHPMADF